MTAPAWTTDQSAPRGSRDPIVGSLFGSQVRSAFCPVSDATADLLPAERVLVAAAVRARRAEFAAGRRLARALLSGLGIDGFALLAGPDRAPRWPAGIVGSISHADGHCAAVVAPRSAAAGLGVDLETAEPLEPELWPSVCTPRERSTLRGLAPAERGRRAKLIFSAKEAAYKCLYPTTRVPLGFQDLETRFEASGRFAVRCGAAAPALGVDLRALRGRFLWSGPFVFTGATLPVDPDGWCHGR
ncbi:MAG: 4'-phosphopantetheinyl transferase superfamily protein [Myxococcota bacterium]|nr:4'-phosphopantetheinyl transferase superfamily protein [Myxococcota bacterium]